MKYLKLLAATAALLVTSAAAQAATFNFNGASAASLTKVFTVDGITVTASAIRFGVAQPGRVTQTGAGLGVTAATGFSDDSGQIDGNGPDDMLILTFDQLVQVAESVFGAVDGNDEWDIFIDDGSGILALFDDDSVVTPYLFGGAVVKRIGFRADESNDNFRLGSINVTAVSLPATGWLLLAGIGGMAALRRKRAAA